MEIEYLKDVRKQFEYHKSLGERTFEQLSDEDLFLQPNKASNSIGVIVNHLYGNMKSRWTDFLISDGEKEWRNRDLEFENDIKTKEELLLKWNDGWACLFEALNSINIENFKKKVFIRNQSHSIIAAVNRQLAHYSYHIGQIVYLGKMMQNEEWKSLTVAKGKSSNFNKEKFNKGKHEGHFSDDIK